MKPDAVPAPAGDSGAAAPAPRERSPAPPKPSRASTPLKLALLAGLLPAVVSVPYALSYAAAFAQRHPWGMYAVWALYAAAQAYVALGLRRATMTVDRLATHNLSWAVLALGAWHVVNIQQIIEPQLRAAGLWVWLAVTMAANIVLLAIDSTDYVALARKEEEKEKRKAEKRKLREEQLKEKRAQIEAKKGKPLWKRNKCVKIFCDILVYAVLVALIFGAFRWVVAKQQERQATGGRSGTAWDSRTGQPSTDAGKTWGYESNTGADFKGLDITDEELEGVSTGPAKPQQQETAADPADRPRKPN
eukprot:m51a1_g14724 hypothetical protein (304) ;mRNA; f:198996-200182